MTQKPVYITLLLTIIRLTLQRKALPFSAVNSKPHLIFSIPINITGLPEREVSYENDPLTKELTYKYKPEITVRFILTPEKAEDYSPLNFSYEDLMSHKAFNLGMNLNKIKIRDLKFSFNLDSNNQPEELIKDLQLLLKNCFNSNCNSEKIIEILSKGKIVEAKDISHKVEENKNKNEEAAVLLGGMIKYQNVCNNNILEFAQIIEGVENNPSLVVYKVGIKIKNVRERMLKWRVGV